MPLKKREGCGLILPKFARWSAKLLRSLGMVSIAALGYVSRFFLIVWNSTVICQAMLALKCFSNSATPGQSQKTRSGVHPWVMQVRKARLIAMSSACIGEEVRVPIEPADRIQFDLVRIKKPRPAHRVLADQDASVKIRMELLFAQRSARSLKDFFSEMNRETKPGGWSHKD